MNKKLKFSWGHILAFVALIWIGYISFIGITYKTEGNFNSAILGVVIIILSLLVVFVGAQLLKSTDRWFKISIIIERGLILISPFIFAIMMDPYVHFWNVKKNATDIEKQFKASVDNSKDLFDCYEDYAKQRIDNYDKMLNRIIRNKQLRRNEYLACGFTGKNDQVQKNNKVEALRLQLLSENYDSIDNLANKWINKASKASVWNVFMIGNINQIDTAFVEWYNTLTEFSSHKLSDEEYKGYNRVYVFDANKETINNARNGLKLLKEKFTDEKGISMIALITCIILYVLLWTPYIAQYRDSKSIYTTIGKKDYIYGSKKRRKKNDHSDDEVDKYEPFIM